MFEIFSIALPLAVIKNLWGTWRCRSERGWRSGECTCREQLPVRMKNNRVTQFDLELNFCCCEEYPRGLHLTKSFYVQVSTFQKTRVWVWQEAVVDLVEGRFEEPVFPLQQRCSVQAGVRQQRLVLLVLLTLCMLSCTQVEDKREHSSDAEDDQRQVLEM